MRESDLIILMILEIRIIVISHIFLALYRSNVEPSKASFVDSDCDE